MSLDERIIFFAYAKKPGTSVIKVTFKNENGKKQTLKTTLRVKKYPEPIKRLKVNGKSVKLSENKYGFAGKCSKSTVKVKMAPKSGWVITNVYGHYYDKNWDMKTANINVDQIKKGSVIKFPKKYKSMDIYICLRNRKNGDSLEYGIDFNR